MFGDKSTFGSSWTGQIMPKKGQQDLFSYIQQGPITLFTICTLFRHRDSNELGNHFRILSVRMVQSAESAWTDLNYRRFKK